MSRVALAVLSILFLHGCAAPSGNAPEAADAGATADAGAPSAELPPALAARIVDLVAPVVDASGAQGKTVGLAVGVVSRKARGMLGFGTVLANQNRPPVADTLFEIGSVSKVFTGWLLARSIERNQHQLSETLEGYFPRGVPRYAGQSITLLDLATHTSGLPPMPTNLHASMPNPAAGYDGEDLADFLATYSLPTAPGERYEYSNLGSGALGYVLGLTSAQGSSDYEALLQRELAGPLGMADTSLRPSAAGRARLAQGYAAGRPAAENDIGPALVGAGAIRSTTEDLLRFLDAALGQGPAEAVTTWKAVLEPRKAITGGHIGLLLQIDETSVPVVYAKNGGTAGFSAQVAFTTSPPAAVVLLANSNQTAGLYPLARAILTELHQLP